MTEKEREQEVKRQNWIAGSKTEATEYCNKCCQLSNVDPGPHRRDYGHYPLVSRYGQLWYLTTEGVIPYIAEYS